VTTARGVGIVFNPVVPHFLEEHPDAVDYIEVIPETLWTDYGRGRSPRYEEVIPAIRELDRLAEDFPIVFHGIALSIGSVLPFDKEHLTQLCKFILRYGVSRFSEHLGFSRVSDSKGGDHHIGLGFPLPCDNEVLDWLVCRVESTTESLRLPLLLENGVRHTPIVEEDMPEPVFLNRLAEQTCCGVLLDLHNLYTDYRNNGWEPRAYIKLLNLDNVREIHVAGGSIVGRAYTDSHAGPSPKPVWDLLQEIVPSSKNLEGITFEFHDSYYPRFGPEMLLAELRQMSATWCHRGNSVP
jgi:uncharacterized protein (UPF0276 family)